MKTRTNAVLVLLAILFYFNGIHTASAFYDPGVQRWLNRDPINEKGGINLYGFVKNDPTTYIDIDGLTAIPFPIGGVGVGGVIGGGVSGAIGAGAAIGIAAGLLLDTYTPVGDIGRDIANKMTPKRTYKTEACRKIADWCDPATGRRFCRFRCDYSEDVFLDEGSGCDKTVRYRVVPE